MQYLLVLFCFKSATMIMKKESVGATGRFASTLDYYYLSVAPQHCWGSTKHGCWYESWAWMFHGLLRTFPERGNCFSISRHLTPLIFLFHQLKDFQMLFLVQTRFSKSHSQIWHACHLKSRYCQGCKGPSLGLTKHGFFSPYALDLLLIWETASPSIKN